MDGKPAQLKSNVACVDYSAVKYGKLAAYRMDGERVLSPDKFVWVDVQWPSDLDQRNYPTSEDSLAR
jgi:hypothetical protein